MMRIVTAHNILKGFFGICLCWYLILKKSVSKSLKFLYFKPILSAILVTIATVKSKKKMPESNTWAILLIYQ